MSFKVEINPELKMKSDIMFKAFYGRKENEEFLQENHWLLFLDMERRELLEMACEKNEKVRRAVENYEVLTGDEEVKRLAEIRLMAKLEEKSALDCAREEGRKQGREQEKRETAEITGLSEEEIKNLK